MDSSFVIERWFPTTNSDGGNWEKVWEGSEFEFAMLNFMNIAEKSAARLTMKHPMTYPDQDN